MYIRGTFRVILNVQRLNMEGSVGNYSTLTRVSLIGRREGHWEVTEAVGVSGNMLKHFHAKHMVNLLLSWGKNDLCDDCKRGVFYRTRAKIKSEEEMVKKCAIDDLHGFLATENQIRRESLIKFSFAVPVEENLFSTTTVTHNRVIYDERGKIEKEKAMMVYKSEYASGLYGFAVSMDLEFIGVPLANPYSSNGLNRVINDDQYKDRVKAAIQALSLLLQGEMGAKMSNSLPVTKVHEALVVTSKKPVPMPVNAYYMDYLESSIELYRDLVEGKILDKKDITLHIITNRNNLKLGQLHVKQHNNIGSLIVSVLNEALEDNTK